MTRDVTSAAAGTAPAAVTGSTRTLLTCGIVAGPLYLVVVVLQMLTRDGFDISRHPASMLSNGDAHHHELVGGSAFSGRRNRLSRAHRRVFRLRPAVRRGRPDRLGGLQRRHRRCLPRHLDRDFRGAGIAAGQRRLRPGDRPRPGMDVVARYKPSAPTSDSVVAWAVRVAAVAGMTDSFKSATSRRR
jgi:hypothetical protein